MGDDSDPVGEATDGRSDLYEIATWEQRTFLDRVAVLLYRGIAVASRVVVVLVGLGILASLVVVGALGVLLSEPIVTVFVVFSALPAFALAAYVWYVDPTSSEPVWLLATAFVLGVVFATFAAIVNGIAQPLLVWIPFVGLPLFFYFVVAPVEETVKLLAVRFSAYENGAFDSVVDGAVYGAFAGLGFAVIENALYVSRGYLSAVNAEAQASVVGMVAGTTVVRSLAGPGHVIYTAIAGYYLGLAKFVPDSRGPIVVKGLLVAALIHATYNTLSGVVPGLLTTVFGVPSVIALVGFILGYDGIFVYYLYRKIARYRRRYEAVRPAT